MEIIKTEKIGFNHLNTLQQIAVQTFSEAFSAANSEKNMKDYIEYAFSHDKLTDEIHNPNSEFYFAVIEEKAVGYLKLNFGQAQTDLKDNKSLEIERIYVFKEFYGKNVGQHLCNKAIETAEQKGLEYLWLGVWEKNPRAIKFYEKNGFQTFGKHSFTLGTEIQTDILMKRKTNISKIYP
jgi:ribosomal protein S18 acetylase RimI-like enzyme